MRNTTVVSHLMLAARDADTRSMHMSLDNDWDIGWYRQSPGEYLITLIDDKYEEVDFDHVDAGFIAMYDAVMRMMRKHKLIDEEK